MARTNAESPKHPPPKPSASSLLPLSSVNPGKHICDRFEWPTPKARTRNRTRATASRAGACESEIGSLYVPFRRRLLPTPQAQTLYFCFQDSCSCSLRPSLSHSTEANYYILRCGTPIRIRFSGFFFFSVRQRCRRRFRCGCLVVAFVVTQR